MEHQLQDEDHRYEDQLVHLDVHQYLALDDEHQEVEELDDRLRSLGDLEVEELGDQ